MTMTTMMTTIKEKPPLKLRHELKYRISLRDDRILASRLGKLFPRDKNAGKEGSYRITSLYFDTPSDTALRQKLEGVDRREKFRLRYYGEDLSFIRLEKKFKMNGLCGKHSARVTRQAISQERRFKGIPSFSQVPLSIADATYKYHEKILKFF